MAREFFLTKLRGKIATFAADHTGAVLPFVASTIIGMLAFATLATDVSRYLDLQTQLQKAADAFALAAAAELDGTPTAITRANAAISTLMAGQNSSVFGAGAVTVQATNFYPALPATDNLPMGATTADPAQARFVQVGVTPVAINTFFPAMLFGAATNTMATSASAVAGGPAGAGQVICGQTPIYVCSGAAGGPTDMMNPAVMTGKEVSLVAPPGSGYSPGNYGFLDVGCGNNTPCLEQALGGNTNGATTCVNS
ncbi:MAG: pilus assembly protein TadG-related protein, partial [Pseudomonadota bacterium]